MVTADWLNVAILVSIAVSDVILIRYNAPTISKRLRVYGYRVSFFPFAWGVIGGHFWGPAMHHPFGSWWAAIAVLVSCGVSLSLIHWAIVHLLDPPDWIVLVYVAMGIPCGVFFWPQ